MTPAQAAAIVERVTAWAGGQDGIRGAALVGSWARGDPREDSDLDVVFLTAEPGVWLVTGDWIAGIGLESIGQRGVEVRRAQYGVVHSFHVTLESVGVVELSIAPASWASSTPIDAGTHAVVRGGFRILQDKDGSLARLLGDTTRGS